MWEHSQKVALLFGINDYRGTENDLNGCVNDLSLAGNALKDFQIRRFINTQVTRQRVKDELEYAIVNSVPGDTILFAYSGHGSYVKDCNADEPDGVDETLYLYDGNLVDDETCEILKGVPVGVNVIMILDSCFSGTSTRGWDIKSRFMPPKKKLPTYTRVKKAINATDNVIIFSACAENETSADAYINGTWNGAFSFYLWNCLRRDMTYQKWYDEVCLYLPNKNFSQHPQIEGTKEMLDKVVFQ